MPIKVSPKLHSLMTDKEKSLLTEEYRIYEINGIVHAEKNSRSVHSKYSIEKESLSILKPLEKEEKKNVYLFYGFGLGYHIAYFAKNAAAYAKNKEPYIIVVVTDIPLFVYSYYNLYIMADIAKHNAFFVWHEENALSMAKNLEAQNVLGVNFITLPSLSKEEKEKASLLCSEFMTSIEKMFSDFFTRLNFENTWTRNIFSNILKLQNSFDISIFKNKLRGFNALIAAAGPTLNKSMEKIKLMRESFFIIAVDTAYSSLCKAGITPDIIVTSDAGIYNSYDFIFENTPYPFLVLDIAVSKNVIDINKNRTKIIYFASNENSLTEYIKNKLEIEITKLSSSNSVATTAVSLANYLGIKNIVLIGYDNSYPNYERHAKHAMSYEYFLMRTNKLKTIESFYFDAIYKRADMSIYPPTDFVFTNLIEYFSSMKDYYKDMNIIRIKEDAVAIESIDKVIDIKEYGIPNARINALKILGENITNENIDKEKMKNMYAEMKNVFGSLIERMNENYNNILANKNDEKEAENIYAKILSDIKTAEEKLPFVKNILLYMSTIYQRQNKSTKDKSLFIASESIKNIVYFHTRVQNILEKLD